MSSLNHTALLMRLDLRSMSSSNNERAIGCAESSWELFGLDAPLPNEGRSLTWFDELPVWLKVGASLFWWNSWSLCLGLVDTGLIKEGKSEFLGLVEAMLKTGEFRESARGFQGTTDTVGRTLGTLLWTSGGSESRGLIENVSDDGGLEVGEVSEIESASVNKANLASTHRRLSVRGARQGSSYFARLSSIT